jgi:Cys-rich repeat protein
VSSRGLVGRVLALGMVTVAWLGAAACGVGEEERIDLLPSAAVGSPCGSDGDCAVPAPYCDSIAKVCVECLTDTNCGKKVCDPITRTCQDCQTSGDCSGNSPYCSSGDCVECLTAGNCPNDAETCDTLEGKCVATCGDDADCTDRARTICAVDRALCVECLTDTECDAAKPRCLADRCRQCATDADCADDKPWCLVERWECKECAADTHCPDGTSCNNGTCKTTG